MIIASLAILMILFILFVYFVYADWQKCRCPPDGPCVDGNGEIHYKGRPHPDDELSHILDRIDWVSTTQLRSNKVMRAYNIAFVSMLIILCLLWRRWPYVYEILILTGAIFLVGLAMAKLYDFHSDIYPIYYIKDNVNQLREIFDAIANDPNEPGSIDDIPHHTVIRRELENVGNGKVIH